MADVGTGTTVAFGTTSFTAELLAVNGTDISRESIDTSHMGTATWKTFMPSDLTDPGGIDLEFAFDPDSQPPINSAAETITITFPKPVSKTAGATLASTGFVQSWSWGSPLEGKMTGTANVKFSGVSTWTDAH